MSLIHSTHTLTIDDMIKYGFRINLESYPVINEETRKDINSKIINHYLYHEIGFDEPALFNHYLGVKMNEVMPIYNKFMQLDIDLVDLFYNAFLTSEQTIESEKERIVTEDKESEQNRVSNDNLEKEDKNERNTNQNEDVDDSGQDKHTGNITNTTNNEINTNDSALSLDVGSTLPQSMITLKRLEDDFYASSGSRKQNSNTQKSDENKTAEDIFNDIMSKAYKTKTDRNTQEEINRAITEKIDKVLKETETALSNKNDNSTQLQNMHKIMKGNTGRKYNVELLTMIRGSMLNIPLMIIQDVAPLFMSVL